jgi:fucose permease
MQATAHGVSRRTLFILHPAFALTAILQAIHGALLPSLASSLHFSDSQSGLLLTLYFSGTALGAILCRPNYSRSLAAGFAALTILCPTIPFASPRLLFPLFLLMGICVGVSCSSVSLFVGRNVTYRCAPTLTLLNFTWSAGALAAPLLAASLLVHFTFRAAYASLAIFTALAAMASLTLPPDLPEPQQPVTRGKSLLNLKLLAIVGLLAFLEIGIENTALAWLATYSLRTGGSGISAAAVFSSLYWCGFMLSRGLSALLLLRVDEMQVFRWAVGLALASAVLLAAYPQGAYRGLGMFLLGTALAPIFPLLIALLFGRIERTADTRWVLAVSGFGGSILPWLTGWLSTRTGSLRLGLITVPVALFLMVCLLPALAGKNNETLA